MMENVLTDVKDHGLWLILKIVVTLVTFVFNYLKIQNINENGILKSRLGSVPCEEVQGSLYQMFERAFIKRISQMGDWVVVRDGLKHHELKATEALQLIRKISAVLTRKGLKQGDSLHLVTNNNNYYHVLVLAIWRLCGVISCGDPALPANTLKYQIESIKAKIVVCAPDTFEKVKQAVQGMDVCLLSIGSIEGVEDLVQMAQNVNQDSIPEPAQVKDAKSDCGSILWSSGTTGTPKGICHCQQALWNMGRNATVPPIHCLMTLHFYHINGVFYILKFMMSGATATYVSGTGFSLPALLKTIRFYRPTALILGSHHYVQLSEFDVTKTAISKRDLNSVKIIVPMGAAVPSICKEKLRRTFLCSAIHFIGYGQTEISIVSLGPQEFQGLGAISKGVQVKVINPDTRGICKPYEHGEICAKSNTQMMGYIDQPHSAYFDKDGFGMTGDIGYYDENGLVHYVDRLKELVKYCNNHVAPTEIEDLLQTHPAVAESLVFGIKEPRVQELLSAVIVLKDGLSDYDEKCIVDFVNNRVDTDFKKLRGKVLFRHKLPRNTSGKLVRQEMRKWAESEAMTKGHSL